MTFRRFGVAAALLLCAAATPLTAQDVAPVVSSEYSMSGREAMMRLELATGRTVQLSVRDGGVFIDDTRIGDAARGSTFDREWREFVTRAMDTSTEQLPLLLGSWHPTGDIGASFRTAMLAAITPGMPAPLAPPAVPAPISDSVNKLVERIAELEQAVVQMEGREVIVERSGRRNRPFRHVAQGIEGIFAILVTYAVFFALGFAVIFLGGRKYIEGVADTARNATGRSFLVGLAACFLAIPAYVLGIALLVISIIGIVGLIAWVPGFPIVFGLSVVLGYLGVAHAIGETFADRRFYVADWFNRGNSYSFLLSGFGVLLALFLASQVVHMFGGWFRAIEGIFIFFGVVLTVMSALIGFGAVLLSRGGTQPVRRSALDAERDLFTQEEAGV